MLNPPKQGDFSYESYQQELFSIHSSLARRAKMLVEAFRNLEGVTCNDAQGAMYVFPQVKFPQKFLDHCFSNNKKPDATYSMEMLNETGVCVVPGSGFGQKKGTYHFRSTFLPPEKEFESFIGKISNFHAKFMKKYQ